MDPESETELDHGEIEYDELDGDDRGGWEDTRGGTPSTRGTSLVLNDEPEENEEKGIGEKEARPDSDDEGNFAKGGFEVETPALASQPLSPSSSSSPSPPPLAIVPYPRLSTPPNPPNLSLFAACRARARALSRSETLLREVSNVWSSKPEDELNANANANAEEGEGEEMGEDEEGQIESSEEEGEIRFARRAKLERAEARET